jgi:hypothetical protein
MREAGALPGSISFRESMSPLGLTLSARKHRDRPLTSGNSGCAELRVPEEMDRPTVPFGQSDQWQDSTRKPKRRRSNAFGGEKRMTNRSSNAAHTRGHAPHKGGRRHSRCADLPPEGREHCRLRRSPATRQEPRLCLTSISFLLV